MLVGDFYKTDKPTWEVRAQILICALVFLTCLFSWEHDVSMGIRMHGIFADVDA